MEIQKSIIVNKPIEQVWEVLGNQFSAAHRWASGLYHSEGIGQPTIAGASCSNRACETSFGSIKEELVTFDPEHYILSYKVTEGFPSFVELGQNTWTLSSQGSQTKVMMTLQIKTKGFMGSLMAPMMKYQMGGLSSNVIEDLKHFIETGLPSQRKAKEVAKATQRAA